MTTLTRDSRQLGNAIRNRRTALGLTQTELAARVSSQQKTISHLESGAPGTRLQTLFDVLAALDLDLTVAERAPGPARAEDIF